MSGHVDRGRRQPTESIGQESEFTVNVTVTKKSASRKVLTKPTSGDDRTNWYSNSPPGYEEIILDEAAPSRTRRSGARREWDNVASRIAARTANTRNTTKRSSRDGPSNRIQKSTPRKHSPQGLSIDTTVSRHLGGKPQQIPINSQRKPNVPVAQASTNAPAYTKSQPTDLGITLGSKFSPETPTILITPAFENKHFGLPGFRGASSIYSRATLAPAHAVDNPTVPEFPKDLPYLLSRPQPTVSSGPEHDHKELRDSTATAFEEDGYDRKMGRITSSGTLFEEDQTPLTAGTWHGDSSRYLTIDTTIPPTPHRSRGWWDVIKTPFDSARSFSFSRHLRSPTDGSRTPDVPPIPSNAFLADRFQEKGIPFEPEPLTRSLSHPEALDHVEKKSSGLRYSKSVSDMKFGPRATHNSQALRRLESNERLPYVSTEPMPVMKSHFSQDTEYTTFSPHEREVPLVLGFNPVSAVEQQSQNPFASENTGVGAQRNLVALPSNGHKMTPPQESPESASTTFSPVGQIAGVGTVPSARATVNSPNKPIGMPRAQTEVLQNSSLASASTRSSLTAQIVKQTPPTSFPPEERRALYFAPPPAAASREASPSRRRDIYDTPPRYPQGRFSSSTIATEKPKKAKLQSRMQYFTICGGKKKDKKDDKEKDGKKTKKSKRRRWCCCCCCFLLFFLVGVAVLLAILLSRKHHTALPSQATFLNITNYPPIPTGALTIARPNLRTSVSGCVNPLTMWSCAVPKEQQAGILPNDPDQPDFAVTIVYDNSSAATGLKARSVGSGAVTARSWVKSLLNVRSTFQPSPSPPLLEEQAFLGNTTDGTTAPFEGESTPFFISFEVPTPSSSNSKKMKRSSTPSSTVSGGPSATTSGINIPTLTTAIPIPDVNPDGTAQPANLLPFPAYQPLRLFNRGLPDEHYGFYTYFDRNIFLKSIKITNDNQTYTPVPADDNGGSTFEGANVRCTWRDTRFLVQIWTNKGKSVTLLPSASGSASSAKPTGESFSRPGTFPYPVTVTLDRHGGGLTTKMLFCYGLDVSGHININSRQFQREDRAFGGVLVNPALGPFQNVNVTKAQGGPGGIDGGTGGCECQWTNWLST